MGKIFLIIVKKAPRLTEPQLKTLIDIGVGFGQLMLGSVVLPFLLPGFDQIRYPVIILGLIAAFLSWTISVIAARRLKP